MSEKEKEQPMDYETLPHDLHLKVADGPLLSTCLEWRERRRLATDAAFAFAKRQGSDGYFPTIDGNLCAITVQPSTPPGWTILKTRRINQPDKLIPLKGSKGDAIRAEIAALPNFPSHHEIAEAIGHPQQLSYEYEGGRGFETMGYRLNPVHLGWAGETFIILCPNAERYVAAKRAEHPGCTINQGEWTIPEGLIPITKAQMELFYAKQAVADEQAA